jgi:hypothetical protein
MPGTTGVAEFNAARRFVLHELPSRLADPVRWRDATQVPFTGEYDLIPTVAKFFETMGLFVKYGIIDERIACDAWSGVVLGSWTALLPVITYLRSKVGSDLWNNFEYLAALSEDYQTRWARTSTYPPKMKRMPEDSLLIQREAAERVNA